MTWEYILGPPCVRSLDSREEPAVEFPELTSKVLELLEYLRSTQTAGGGRVPSCQSGVPSPW